jgi:exodeoxyribonuclease VII small subunit
MSQVLRAGPSDAKVRAAMATKKKTDVAEEGAPSFEAAMTRLSAIVESLESGDLSLEESLARFEEGVRLARTSQATLDAAEHRVEELLRLDEQGAPVIEEMDEP